FGALSLGHAQVTTGTILGTARDATGAVVPGVKITVTNQRTNATRELATDDRGSYAVPALLPSEYSVKAEARGFKSYVAENIVLPVGAEVRMDLVLQVGDVSEQVTVAAEAPLLQSDSSSLAHVVDQRRIVELPLNGRNFLELAALSAGASPKTPFRVTQFGNRNQYVTIGGGRDSSTNYLIDGIEARSLRFNNSSLQPSIDAIQEFKVERNSFSAEYGRGVAVINTAIKPGTNDFHGTLYEFFRNDKLDTRNFFDARKPPFRQNQYGYSFGGPLRRDRTFFFTNYEALRARKGRTFLATVPDPRQLSGDFAGQSRIVFDPSTTRVDPSNPAAILRTPFAGNVVPTNRIHRFAQVYNTLLPPPNLPGASLNYTTVRPDEEDADQFHARMDHRFSSSDSIFGRYSWYDGNQLVATAFHPDPRPQSGQNVTLQHLHIFSPSLLNELRLGYNRAIHFTRPLPVLGDRNIVEELGLRNLGGLKPALFGIPTVSISGFSNRGENGLNQGAVENIVTINNKFTVNKGRHNFRVGVEYQNIRYQQQGEVSPRGNFTFSGVFTDPAGTTRAGTALADYLLGVPFSAQAGLGDAVFNLQSYSFAVFLQNDIRITSRLTLNLGLRWQFDQPIHEKTFKEGFFAEDLGLIAYSKEPTGLIFPALQGKFVSGASVRRGINDPDYNNYSPRIGLAWRPWGNDTVIRTGFGVFYDNVNGNEWQFFGLLPPFYGINAVFSRSDFPSFTMSDMFVDVNSLTDIPAPFSIFRRDRTPYSLQWNFNIQRRLTRNTALEVAYHGAGSHKLWKRFNQNQATPDLTGRIPIQERVPYPAFQAGLLTSGRDSNAIYNAASVKIERSFAAGLNYQAVYTFSRNIDYNSGEFEANQTRFRWNKNADRGLSRYHQKHRFVSNFGYELPIGPGKRLWSGGGAAARKLLEGWQVQGILTFSSGFPFTPTANAVHNTGSFVPQFADRIGDGNLPRGERRPSRWFDTTAFARPAVGTLGTSGRNVLIGPGVNNVDVSFLKDTRVTERVRLQFRGEFFNFTNTPLFAEPSGNVDALSFGLISAAADPRRLQFGLKVIF
ncbi:MAG: TonB-dependent receptor domain-containing protein, partial [Bryobacteraceae bacterium]